MFDSPGSPKYIRPNRSLIRRSALSVALLIALAVTLAACGGGSPTSGSSTTTAVASSGGSGSSGASNSAEQQALKYAQCMRSHGVTNFADPTPGKSVGIGESGIDTNSPTYQAAASACQQYQPTAGNNGDQGPSSQVQSQQLKFAECMRKHGVPNFPEGSSGSGPQNITSYGIDPNSPTFQAANQACSSLLPSSGG
jgi:hypothetical protein